jgi:hypothetical protein
MNKPVAWMVGGELCKLLENAELQAKFHGHSVVALYTNPAKTLTDEEIDAVGDEVSNLIDTYAGRREFARAILRKVQDK